MVILALRLGFMCRRFSLASFTGFCGRFRGTGKGLMFLKRENYSFMRRNLSMG